jgi:hypothetical protein
MKAGYKLKKEYRMIEGKERNMGGRRKMCIN